MRFRLSRIVTLSAQEFTLHFSLDGISTPTTEGTRLLLSKTPIPRLPCTPLGLEVECAPAVLDFVCKESAMGARSLAKGGLEVGGVLFGTHDDGLIRILAARPIECEHRLGPSFVLSDTDEVRLAQMLADSKLDRELSSLEPLGCYLSHSRHGATLTDSDVQLLNRHFAGTCQLALILIPHLPIAININFLALDSQGVHAAFHELEYSMLNGPGVEMGTGRQSVSRPPLNRASTAAKLHCEVVPTKPPPCHQSQWYLQSQWCLQSQWSLQSQQLPASVCRNIFSSVRERCFLPLSSWWCSVLPVGTWPHCLYRSALVNGTESLQFIGIRPWRQFASRRKAHSIFRMEKQRPFTLH